MKVTPTLEKPTVHSKLQMNEVPEYPYTELFSHPVVRMMRKSTPLLLCHILEKNAFLVFVVVVIVFVVVFIAVVSVLSVLFLVVSN